MLWTPLSTGSPAGIIICWTISPQASCLFLSIEESEYNSLGLRCPSSYKLSALVSTIQRSSLKGWPKLAIHLQTAHVHIVSLVSVIQQQMEKLFKSRFVPFHTRVTLALSQYQKNCCRFQTLPKKKQVNYIWQSLRNSKPVVLSLIAQAEFQLTIV